MKRRYKVKRLNVSISEELHTQLKIAVATHRTTIAQFVAEAIAEKIKRDKGDSK